jgi:dehydrogenase/reductase SDR family member 12
VLVGSGLARLVDTALDRLVVPGYTRIGCRVRACWWPADAAVGSLAGRVAVVTGATSGLGVATAAGLAALGARVRLVVRDREKGERIAAGLSRRLPAAEFDVDRCDLADLSDVRRYGVELATAEPAVHALVHNAGVLPARRTETAQGHEVTLATHVLGPLLLTELLRPALGADAGRVVFVSSGGMYTQGSHADDPEFREGQYRGAVAYARTKRMQVLLAERLARELGGEGVVVHACHPGWADTPGVAGSLPGFHTAVGPLLRSPAEGADTAVWLASADEPGEVTGRFWHDRAPRPTVLLPWTHTGAADRDRLWRYCRAAVGLTDA